MAKDKRKGDGCQEEIFVWRDGRWQRKAVAVAKAILGIEVFPKSYKIVFKDGNSLNCAPGNIEVIHAPTGGRVHPRSLLTFTCPSCGRVMVERNFSSLPARKTRFCRHCVQKQIRRHKPRRKPGPPLEDDR